MVYFIQDTGSGAIKIGVSRNPAARLADLQTAHHSELRLLGVMDGMEQQERQLHQQFSCIRGEWFVPSQELLAFIDQRSVSLALLDYPIETDQPVEVTHIIHWPMISIRAYCAVVILWGTLAVWSITFWIIPNTLGWMPLGDRILIDLISALTVPLGALHFVTRKWRPIQITRLVSRFREPSLEVQIRRARREANVNKFCCMCLVIAFADAVCGLVYGLQKGDIPYAGWFAGGILLVVVIFRFAYKEWRRKEALAKTLTQQVLAQ